MIRYWGIYLALEAVEDSFRLRNYGTENGELYKPDSMNIGGNMNSFSESGFSESIFSESNFSGGGFSMGGSGADLNYTDNKLESYSTIWEGEVTNTTDTDHKRVVTALKNISEGTNLEEYMNVDNLLKYMAVHVFSVNEDSLSGVMAHNYYLYESNGQLNILPWDYNLSLGGMQNMGSASATSVVNDGIENAFSGTDFFDTLMDKKEYHETYYSYLQQIVDSYIKGGGFEKFYNRTRNQIDSLVEADPTAFYSYEEYLTAIETLCEVVKLRGESINGQIEGSIPATTAEQKDSDKLIDASHLDLSVMGSMSMGNSFGNQNFDEKNTSSEAVREVSKNAEFVNEELPEDFDPSQFGGKELPEDFDPSQFENGEMPEDFDPSQFGNKEILGESNEGQEGASDSEQTGQSPDDKWSDGGKDFDNFSGMMFGNAKTNSALIENLITFGVSFLVLIPAFVFVKLYRRKPRNRY